MFPQKADLRSLDFVIDRLFMKLFRTNDMDSASQCERSSWPPYGIRQAIIFSSAGFFFLSSSFCLFSSHILNRRRLDVYHTSTHDVALVRI